jgi:hypothetical protein
MSDKNQTPICDIPQSLLEEFSVKTSSSQFPRGSTIREASYALVNSIALYLDETELSARRSFGTILSFYAFKDEKKSDELLKRLTGSDEFATEIRLVGKLMEASKNDKKEAIGNLSEPVFNKIFGEYRASFSFLYGKNEENKFLNLADKFNNMKNDFLKVLSGQQKNNFFNEQFEGYRSKLKLIPEIIKDCKDLDMVMRSLMCLADRKGEFKIEPDNYVSFPTLNYIKYFNDKYYEKDVVSEELLEQIGFNAKLPIENTKLREYSDFYNIIFEKYGSNIKIDRFLPDILERFKRANINDEVEFKNLFFEKFLIKSLSEAPILSKDVPLFSFAPNYKEFEDAFSEKVDANSLKSDLFKTFAKDGTSAIEVLSHIANTSGNEALKKLVVNIENIKEKFGDDERIYAHNLQPFFSDKIYNSKIEGNSKNAISYNELNSVINEAIEHGKTFLKTDEQKDLETTLKAITSKLFNSLNKSFEKLLLPTKDNPSPELVIVYNNDGKAEYGITITQNKIENSELKEFVISVNPEALKDNGFATLDDFLLHLSQRIEDTSLLKKTSSGSADQIETWKKMIATIEGAGYAQEEKAKRAQILENKITVELAKNKYSINSDYEFAFKSATPSHENQLEFNMNFIEGGLKISTNNQAIIQTLEATQKALTKKPNIEIPDPIGDKFYDLLKKIHEKEGASKLYKNSSYKQFSLSLGQEVSGISKTMIGGFKENLKKDKDIETIIKELKGLGIKDIQISGSKILMPLTSEQAQSFKRAQVKFEEFHNIDLLRETSKY